MRKHVIAKFVSILMVVLVFCSLSCPAQVEASSGNKRDQLQRDVESLCEEIALIQSECNAIDTRLEAINQSIVRNYDELDRAQNQCLSQKEKINRSLSHIYRNRGISMLEVLLDIKDFEDLLVHFSYIQKINESDLVLLKVYRKKQEKMDRLREDLEKNKSEMLSLKKQKHNRLSQLQQKLAEKQYLLSQADFEMQQEIKIAEERRANEKQVLIAQSVPLGCRVGVARCDVFPSLDKVYLTSERMPSSYETTGIKFGGVASWYGDEFNGKPTASGEIFNENDFTCASRTLPFGTFLSVTYGSRHIVVKVTDRGPFVSGRVLDLSKAAAKSLGISGIGTIDAEIVKPK